MCFEEKPRVLGETDGARADGERGQRDGLPDEQETHEPAEALRAVGFGKIAIGAAGAGHGGAQLGPDHAVAERHQGAQDPAEDRLRTVHFGEQNRYGDERPDADHLQHVGGSSPEKTDTADEMRGIRLRQLSKVSYWVRNAGL